MYQIWNNCSDIISCAVFLPQICQNNVYNTTLCQSWMIHAAAVVSNSRLMSGRSVYWTVICFVCCSSHVCKSAYILTASQHWGESWAARGQGWRRQGGISPATLMLILFQLGILKAYRVCAETQTSASERRAGSLGGYSSSTMQKSLADDSEWEIDGGENTRGKGAAEHCFPPAFRQDEHVRPPVCEFHVSQRIWQVLW